ncbi:hypothetical protein ANCDUO_04407 [Ancylostoma duodenale]|uniref:Uncharacterized protein n=1 Tax=Ancylostoma duodenale TaxID=51022 RepID=A0A0C2D6M7_9BILA|nr:hypothetical protein ANCDUO_04407 [Ancylostoma duodenale]
MSALTCNGTDQVRVFTKATVPVRFHYSESKRIGDYIIVGQRDTNIYSTAKEVNLKKKGAHGFDYIQPEMHTIMFARGPSFKEKVVLPPYLTVEYMNLWTSFLATLIELYDAKNNEQLLSSECTFHLTNRSDSCKRFNISEQEQYQTLSAFPGRVLAHECSLIVPWKPNFIRGMDSIESTENNK